ncbi:hypothetical protein AVEN_137682-1 [Araneus ventricosus]|uniref:Uncharacterized protein n=1 Tax=Araneus ventricosus TaxID=182803 RepID=A0A4Y2X559_ARAVE|nr:hypothetical protein AVEN_137682-1 [Araneus ventricosus]
MQHKLISLVHRGGMELHRYSANNQSLLCDEMKESYYSFTKGTKTLDLLSRGLKAESLLHNEEWWKGPLYLQSDELPETVCECSDRDEDYLPELKSKNSKDNIVLTLNSNKTFFDYIVNHS